MLRHISSTTLGCPVGHLACWQVEDQVNFEFVAKYLAYFGLKSPTSKDAEALPGSTLFQHWQIDFQSFRPTQHAPGGLESCGEKIQAFGWGRRNSLWGFVVWDSRGVWHHDSTEPWLFKMLPGVGPQRRWSSQGICCLCEDQVQKKWRVEVWHVHDKFYSIAILFCSNFKSPMQAQRV